MSDHFEERLDPDEYDEVPDQSEQLDQDQFQPDYGLTGRDVDDALDEGLTTPQRWSAAERGEDHESIDERIEEEIPDDAESVDSAEPLTGAPTDGTVPVDEAVGAGDRRAGRLVDENEGIGPDDESELIGEDVGIDAAAASAEEAAVHIVDDAADGDEG
jgi:hypothetical protein